MIKKVFETAACSLKLAARSCLQLAAPSSLQLVALSFSLAACSFSPAHGQTSSSFPDSARLPPPGYFQQEVNYDIHVKLDDATNSLTADETLQYINHSPDTLTFIWFHLWPNGYKNNTTALYKQLSTLSDRKDKLKKITDNGYIDHLDFTVDGKKIVTQTHPKYIDIIKLFLPAPLLPGGQITIATPFFVKIPSYFSRLGHQDGSYMMTQWYPKPAVYDRKGWHEFPYLDQGEFYSEFGSYDVHITLRAPFTVGATGTLMSPGESALYKDLGRYNLSHPDLARPLAITQQAGLNELKTLDYHAGNVHDFAWFADESLTINYDTLQLAPGRIVDVFSYFHRRPNTQWIHSIGFIKDAVRHYSNWIGEYAYPVVSALEGPGNTSSGGMEYPMITMITSPGAGSEELDGVIAHEVGHNWFYGMLGSNERQHPWMDEGINSFYEFRYEAEKYRDNSLVGTSIPDYLRKKSEDDFLDAIYVALNQTKTAEPIETPAADFRSEYDYGVVEYTKTAVWMYLLEKSIGKDLFEKGMQNYFSTWKFRHPYPEDLERSLEQITHKSLAKLFALLNQKGSF
jgi:hypothetical protein